MSVTPISSSSIMPSQQQSSSMQSNWKNMMSSLSSTLGLSGNALQQQLQSGQSLSSIAATQGVSQQTLVQSISTALAQNGSQGSSSQLQQIATNIANRTHGAGGHHRHHGGGSGAQQATESTFLAALEASTSATSTAPFGTASEQSSSTSPSQVDGGLDAFA